MQAHTRDSPPWYTASAGYTAIMVGGGVGAMALMDHG
jgi:hypothetical protein